ncbi:MAG: hypothetical protein WBA93_11560 [Microcoleaceae cyanobacterium]
MDNLLIKRVGLSTITICLNILLPTKVLALPEVNYHNNQSNQDVDTLFLKQSSEESIFYSAFRQSDKPYKPEDNGGPDNTEASGTR